MSLPISESTQPEVTQPESNPTLESVQNAEAIVDKPAETLPTSENSNEVANKPEIQNSNDEPKVVEPASQPKEEEKVTEAKPEIQSEEQEVKLPEAVSEPKEEIKAVEPKEEIKAVEPKEEIKPVEPQAEDKPNLEAAKEENSDNSAPQENVEAKEGEEDVKPKRQYRKRGAKFDDFEKYNDTGSYIPATSRSGRAIKKATVFQAAEPAPAKRQRSASANTPADILIKKRGRKPKSAADSDKAKGGASKASGTKKKAGRPKKSDKAAVAVENDSKPEKTGASQLESQSVPSATVGNATIPAVLDNQSIPQQDPSISQFPPQLASNTLPHPTPQNFENPVLGISQNEPISNVIPAQQQAPSNQFQQSHPIAPIVPTLSSNLPPVSGYQPPVNAGIPPSFNPPAPVDQQIINNTVPKPGEIPAQFANPPPTQNQATFAAPAQFATDSAPANTATYN